MLVLSSPSGAGKTSICRKILESENDVAMSVSYTTRKKEKVRKMVLIIFLYHQINLKNLRMKVFLSNMLKYLIIGTEHQKQL